MSLFKRRETWIRSLEPLSQTTLVGTKSANQHKDEPFAPNFGQIVIVRVRENVDDGKRLDIPMNFEFLNAVRKAVDDAQMDLL
jgi:hypothetical protein